LTETDTNQELEQEDHTEMDIATHGAIAPTPEVPKVSFESREIETGKLKIRPQYQRPLNENRVKKMAEAFDDELAGTIEVSFADGHYWVVDGQHRLAAMRAKGIRICRVLIHYGLTIEEEARLFGLLNSERMAVQPRDLYRAELLAGVERTVAVAASLQKYGLHLVNSGNDRTGVAAVRHLWELQERRSLDDTLLVVKKGWSDGEGVPVHGALEGRVLAALGRFIANNRNHERFSLDRLAAVLMKHRPDELVREARVAGLSWGAGSRDTLYRWYNYGLQNKLPFKTYSPGPK